MEQKYNELNILNIPCNKRSISLPLFSLLLLLFAVIMRTLRIYILTSAIYQDANVDASVM